MHELHNVLEVFKTVYALSKQSHLSALVAVDDAEIVLALAWAENLLQLEQLAAYSQAHYRDLTQGDLHLRERWWASQLYLGEATVPFPKKIVEAMA